MENYQFKNIKYNMMYSFTNVYFTYYTILIGKKESIYSKRKIILIILISLTKII